MRCSPCECKRESRAGIRPPPVAAVARPLCERRRQRDRGLGAAARHAAYGRPCRAYRSADEEMEAEGLVMVGRQTPHPTPPLKGRGEEIAKMNGWGEHPPIHFGGPAHSANTAHRSLTDLHSWNLQEDLVLGVEFQGGGSARIRDGRSSPTDHRRCSPEVRSPDPAPCPSPEGEGRRDDQRQWVGRTPIRCGGTGAWNTLGRGRGTKAEDRYRSSARFQCRGNLAGGQGREVEGCGRP